MSTPDPVTSGRAAYLPATATLVVADLHVGRGEDPAVALPFDERADLVRRLRAAVEATDPETVVFAGDLLHRFDGPSRRALETIRTLAGLVRAAGARPVALAGNHDGGLADAWPGRVAEAHRLADGTVVCHGHRVPDPEGVERYVCGHVHPALTAAGRKRDCFLRGPGHGGRPVLVLPAFSALAAGVRVERRAAVDSPLVTDLDAFRPGVVDDEAGETLWFPSLGDIRPRLGR